MNENIKKITTLPQCEKALYMLFLALGVFLLSAFPY